MFGKKYVQGEPSCSREHQQTLLHCLLHSSALIAELQYSALSTELQYSELEHSSGLQYSGSDRALYAQCYIAQC